MVVRGDDAELDVIDLDDADIPPPPDINAPLRALLAPLRRWWWVLAVVVVADVLLLGAYIAVSVTGVWQVESTWQAALSLRERYDEHLVATFEARSDVVRVGHPEDAVKEAARIYAERLGLLRDDIDDVRAVDPAVRRARAAVAASLDRRAADARGAASEPTPTLDLAPTEGDPVTHLVRRALGRFRLEETERPSVAPLDVRRPPKPLAPVPTGARLIALGGEGAAVIDIDGGVTRALVRGEVSSLAVGRTYAGWVQGFGQAFIAPLAGGPEVRVGRADAVWSAGNDTFWLEESVDGEGELRLVDATGKQLRAPVRISGHVIGVSGASVVTTPVGTPHDLHVWDTERGAVVRTLRSAHAEVVAAGLVVSHRVIPRADGWYAVGPLEFSITRLDSRATVRPEGGRLRAHAVAVSRDGGRVALMSDSHMTIFAGDNGRKVASFAMEGGLPGPAAWSADGRFVFVSITEGPGSTAIVACDVATGQLHRLDVSGELYDLVAF